MSKTELKKHLQTLTKDQVIEQVLLRHVSVCST